MKSRDPRSRGSAGLAVIVLSLVVSICVFGMASTVLAGNNPSAKAAVHVRAHSAKAGCNPGFDTATGTCSDIVTTEAGFSFDAFPVFFNLTEYKGCEYSLDWPASWGSATFTNCADFVIGGITFPGDGASHTWTGCFTGICVPSFLWIYASTPDLICQIGHPEHGFIYVLDCDLNVDEPIQTYCAGVYGATGDDPCAEGAICQVTPTTLDFGTVSVGEYLDLSFVLKNIGGGTLEGEVTTGCTQYSIQSGGGTYTLAAEESVIVVIRFEPAAAGYDECTIVTGADCSDVTCMGTGENPPVCEVTPTTLDFGTVTIGQFAGRNFTIQNTGGGVLSGDVTEACGDYSITSNGGPFSLGAGEQVTVGVRFTPTTPGLQECTVETGQAICADVSCSGTGEEAPSCEVVPTTLDFGTVTVGESKDTTFTITNTGGGTLTGEVAEACADYEITDGGGAFSLGGAESRVVTVRFAPTTAGLKECTVTTGTDCDDVACTGTGEEPPQCLVDPTSIDFGSLFVGESKDTTFIVTNTGGGVLTGEVAESCLGFAITDGAGAFALGASETLIVTVQFAPGEKAVFGCTVTTGTNCDDVSCTGTGLNPPECELDPLDIDFGTVTVGEFKDSTFTVTNIGDGTLTGTVSEACDDFEIVSGGGAYALGSGESVVVTVRFIPASSGLKECTVDAGTSCPGAACSGVGEEPPDCQVSPTALDFGTLTVGESADRVFTIENIGEGLLTGEVTETCDYYQIISGGGAYSLGAAETRDVTVRFSPILAGDFGCTIESGTFCDNVVCDGSAEALQIYVDIRPGECPNKLRVEAPFAIPVAVLGTAEFSVLDVDPSTIRLTREGMAAEVSPLSWNLTDVGTPFMGSLCDCHTLGMDGFQDLRLRFGIEDVATILNLAPLAGSQVALKVTGNLTTGEEIGGSDCVLVISGLFGEDVFGGDLGIITHSGLSPKSSRIAFSYYTKNQDHIVLQVFDVQGRTVATLVDEVKAPGIYEVSWETLVGNGGRIPAGVYFARISNGSTSSTEKVMILK